MFKERNVKTMINNENKEIKLKANAKKVTIEIPTDLLTQVFYDAYEGEAKIKNKKIFREKFADYIRERLEEDGTLEEVADTMLGAEDCVKIIGE